MDVTESEPVVRHHDLVVIGASAGGVEVLRTIVAALPADLRATVCVVLHISPETPSALASILDRAGPLPCRPAADGEPLRVGEILVAPPGRHLTVADGRIALTAGPRENGHRPSVDVLFRSAAWAGDGRVVGVVLSGSRDDGTAGLALIKARGGATLVQDPADALCEGMPSSAIMHVNVDAVAPSGQLAAAIVEMVNAQRAIAGGAPDALDEDVPEEGQVISICPECGGVLSEVEDSGILQWECRVGHRYSPHSLADAQAQDIEAALWAGVRALDDRKALLERMGEQFGVRGSRRSAQSFIGRAAEAATQAELLREVLRRAAETTLQRVDDSEPDP